MSNIIKDKVHNAKLLVNLAYLRTEYASQNTYYATMRMAFAIALVSAYTKNFYVLAFSIIILIGGYIQYKFMGNILIEINEVTRNNKKNVNYNDLYKLREFNNLVFIFYTIIFIIAIFLQFNHDKKKLLTNIMKSIK
jgi:hypothetical protein